MGLFEYIERQQNKPKHKRQRIALGTSAAITAIIAVFWLGGMTSGFGLATDGSDTVAGSNQNNPAESQVASPFSSLKKDFSSTVGAISEEWRQLTDSDSSTSTAGAATTTSAVASTTTSSSSPSLVDRSEQATSTATSSTSTVATSSSLQ